MRRLLARVRAGEVGGVILFGRNTTTHRPGRADGRRAPGGGAGRREPAAPDRDRPGGRPRQAAPRPARALARGRWARRPRLAPRALRPEPTCAGSGSTSTWPPCSTRRTGPRAGSARRAFSRNPKVNASLGPGVRRRAPVRARGGDRQAFPRARHRAGDDGHLRRRARHLEAGARGAARSLPGRDRRRRRPRDGEQRRLHRLRPDRSARRYLPADRRGAPPRQARFPRGRDQRRAGGARPQQPARRAADAPARSASTSSSTRARPRAKPFTRNCSRRHGAGSSRARRSTPPGAGSRR